MLGDKDIDEAKLATIIEDFLSDVRFDKFNFAWHMSNKSPRIQREFYELFFAFIEEMANAYKRGLVDTKNYHIAQLCYEVMEYINNRDRYQLELPFV